MLHSPKRPRYMLEQDLQDQIETRQTLSVQIPVAIEEASSSCSPSPLVPNFSEGVPAAGTPSTPQSPQRISATSTSSYISDESSSSKEENVNTIPVTESLLNDALDKKVVDLVQFLLRKYRKKEPITKEDMLKMIIRNYKEYFPVILKKTRECLELVFGLDVKEADTIGQLYVFEHTLDLTYDGMLSDDRGMPKTGLLILILSLIFMEGNCASEEEIWRVLNATGVYEGREHLIYGEPRKFITEELVQEKYLEYRRVAGSDPPRYEFLWGPRAHAETSKMKVLKFLVKVIDSAPTSFPAWYEDALRDEEEKVQTRNSTTNTLLPMIIAVPPTSSTFCPK
ncbi:melanoma-associated antigen 10-like [Tamandua tetradactyla]|uniref:melanoma-associated antigen 10-like n=1 Tax=Tamandua tetradactyla TaxID=48850 RepID=UPI0040545C5C